MEKKYSQYPTGISKKKLVRWPVGSLHASRNQIDNYVAIVVLLCERGDWKSANQLLNQRYGFSVEGEREKEVCQIANM